MPETRKSKSSQWRHHCNLLLFLGFWQNLYDVNPLEEGRDIFSCEVCGVDLSHRKYAYNNHLVCEPCIKAAVRTTCEKCILTIEMNGEVETGALTIK